MNRKYEHNNKAMSCVCLSVKHQLHKLPATMQFRSCWSKAVELCRLQSVSQTTTSGISVGSSRRFCLCDAAAHSDVVFCTLQMFLLTYLLTSGSCMEVLSKEMVLLLRELFSYRRNIYTVIFKFNLC